MQKSMFVAAHHKTILTIIKNKMLNTSLEQATNSNLQMKSSIHIQKHSQKIMISIQEYQTEQGQTFGFKMVAITFAPTA